ncbi:MAG: hypothetical protein AAF579_16295 [Cyanobacteria bacterium P01_C01_bin.118]
MREVTYFRAQDSDFADVRDHTVFHLKAPDLVQILSKRVKYVENLLESGDHRLKIWCNQQNWEHFHQASLQNAKIIKQTFLEESNAKQNLSILAALAWHNVRYFLRSLKKTHTLLGSTQSWSPSLIIGSLMVPTNPIESKASLSNLYLPTFKEYKCYFLKIRILLLLLRAKPQTEAQRGVKIEHILKFARMYSYQDRWTRKALQDMVQQRLLECIQVPTEITYTANYKIKDNHTFRASPLSAMLIENAQFNYVYLCLLGYDLPFHSSSRLEDFIESIQDLVELAEDSNLTESIDLLIGTDSGRITARYLLDNLKFECPISQKASSLPEISIVEEKLDEIKIGILNITGISIQDHKQNSTQIHKIKEQQVKGSNKNSEEQLSLLTPKKISTSKKQVANHATALRRCISVPKSMFKLQKLRTRLEPMIFWALLEIRARGDELTIAAEVERVINQFLTDEYSRVEPTNIARKLRSSTMQKKEWLVTVIVDEHSEKKHYGLSKNWKTYWLKLFAEPAPEVE